jgi:DNA-directed RNA polymerase subunit RPC12/RpoP
LSLEERLRVVEAKLEDKTAIRFLNVSPTFICINCGVYIFLDLDIYRNIKDAPIRCKSCNNLHILTMEHGQLKKVELKR